MAKSPVEVWLWLLLVMQPYNRKTVGILSSVGNDATRACEQIRDGKVPFLSDKEIRRAKDVRMGIVREVLKACGDNGIRIITMDDEEYPAMLRQIYNPPIVLFCAGSLEGLSDRLTIAAVGARDVSEYGVYAANRIITPLAKAGTVIVSGLAVGSDAAAHRACLKAGGRTVGVLGCGILVNYPAENAGLKREIVNSGGAVISELLPNSRSSRGYFSFRNRIISGLAHGTLVLEAGEKSGSLLTASHALEQNRELFCVSPHDSFAPGYLGQVSLLRSGAIPVYGYTDILDDFAIRLEIKNIDARENDAEGFKGNGKPYNIPKPSKSPEKPNSDAPEILEKPRPDVSESSEKTHSGVPESPETPGTEAVETPAPAASLDPKQAAVYKALTEQPYGEDDIVEMLDLDFSELSEIITSLELLDLIEMKDGLYTAK